MKKINHFAISLLLVGITMSACSASSKDEINISPEHTKQRALQTASQALPQATQENTRASVENQAETPHLTLESTSEEIREKMLTSFLNWQTMEVQALSENSSLNPDDSMAYTLPYDINIWIDQENFRFRTNAQQLGVDAPSGLSISDGNTVVTRAVSSVIDGAPKIPYATYIHPISVFIADGNAMDMIRSGETSFPPMGSVLAGRLRAEIFSSSYAVQYPGEYEALGLESIADRETLKVFYDDADRWGRFNVQHTLWIDTETGVVLKAHTDGTPDHFIFTMEITHIAYNLPLDAELFNVEDAMPDLKLTEMQSATVEGNTIYAGNLKMENDQVSLDVCYELPSGSDWMLYDMTVNGEERVNPNGYLIYMEPAGTFHEKGLRCDWVSFNNAIKGQELHFEIGQLFAPAREGDGCIASEQVSQALEEAGMPIEFTCTEDHGMIFTEIHSKPDDMTEDEAKMKVGDLLVQLRNENLPGPWVFDLKLLDE